MSWTVTSAKFLIFSKTRGTEFVGAMEIARRAGNKRRFYRTLTRPRGANADVDRGILEHNPYGCYRIKPVSLKVKTRTGLRRTLQKFSRKAAGRLNPVMALLPMSITAALIVSSTRRDRQTGFAPNFSACTRHVRRAADHAVVFHLRHLRPSHFDAAGPDILALNRWGKRLFIRSRS